MDPNNIWARPAIPLVGEATKEALYTSVGRALSEWEQFESMLSLLFAFMIGLHAPSEPARRAYGSVVSFSTRHDIITSTAVAYFDEHPDEEYETTLRILMKTAKVASTRRNEITHAQVTVYPIAKPTGYFLLPSGYGSKRAGIGGEPTYAYTCAIIDRFSKQFTELQIPAAQLFVAMSGKHGAQRAGRIPPSTPRQKS